MMVPSRRDVLLSSAALAGATENKMKLAIHQTTSAAAGYRKSLEGWAKAGIELVELTDAMLDGFLKTEDLSAARRVLTDHGLTAVQGALGVSGLWEPNPNRGAAFALLKKRCEMYAQLGLKNVYATTFCTQKVSLEDYKSVPGSMHEAGEIARQFGLALRVEFIRQSTFISTLPTLLKMTRAAGHASVAPMFDFYHFLTGWSKMEDLDLLRQGEIAHVHRQDVPDLPRELLDGATRVIPGDGVAPLALVLSALAKKGYAGPLSVELFLPQFQQGDPFAVAREIREKTEAVMRRALVL